MQSGILNLLLGVPAAGNAAAGASLLDADGGGSGAGDLFSQLLGDTGAQLGQDNPGSNNLLANSDSNLTPTALMAQEVDLGAVLAQSNNAQQAIALLLNQDVTPEQAAALVTKIDQMTAGQGQQQGGQQPDLWQQLKTTLQQVASGSEPQKLSTILQSVPALPADAIQQADASDTNPSPLMQSILAFLQTAFDKTKEVPLQQQAAVSGASQVVTPVSSTTTSLQAAAFRPDEPVDEASAQPQEPKKERTVIEIVPLSQPVLIPVWVQQVANGQPINDPALDDAIPPLALSGDNALPLVSLPPSGLDAAATDSDVAAASTPATGFVLADADSPANQATATPEWMQNLPFPLARAEAPAPAATPAAPVEVSEQHVEANDAPEFIAVGNNPPVQGMTNNTSSKGTSKSAASSKDSELTAKAADSSDITASTSTNTLAVNAAAATPANRMAAHSTAQAAAYNPAMHASPTEQVHVAIRQAGEGVNHITIQLDPADLGRVEVSMNTGADGRTHMSFVADKSSTLDALSRGAVNLERSLADTGIKADAGNMQFNLRQQPQPQLMGDGTGQGSGQSQQSPNAYPQQQSDNSSAAPVGATPVVTRNYTVNVTNGVDIHA